jgi:hypothetical protein
LVGCCCCCCSCCRNSGSSPIAGILHIPRVQNK